VRRGVTLILRGGGRGTSQLGRVEGARLRGDGSQVVRLEEGGGDSLQEGVQGGLRVVSGVWGPSGAQRGPRMIPDVTGHVGRTGGVGCPRALLIRWQL